MAGPIKANKVKAARVDWLWEERIPRGMLSVVAGRPDQAKGLFAITVGADVTKEGGNVLHSSIEDSASIMTRPRYEAAGANLNRVHLWRFMLPSQFAELESHIATNHIDLLVIDPFSAHLGSGVSRHSDNIRTVLNPLSEMLEAYNCACIIIEHALKRIPVHGDPLNAIGGTGSGLPAAARMAFVFGVDPADDDHRMLCCVKANIRAKPKAIQFLIDTVELGRIGPVPQLVYDDEVEFDAMRLFDGRGRHGVVGRPPDKRKQAAEWLTAYLVDAGKPVPVKKIREDAKQYQMSQRTLERAAIDMQIKKIPPGGGPKVCWDLADDVKKMLADDDDDAIEAKAKQLAKDIEEGAFGDPKTAKEAIGLPPDKPALEGMKEEIEPTELDQFLAKLLEEDEKSAGEMLDDTEAELKGRMEDDSDSAGS
jgi:hypothetical protein